MALNPEAIAAAAKAAPMPFTQHVEPVKGRVLHVDGDYCAYYCAGSDDTDPGTARRNLIDRIDTAAKASGSERIIIHLSDQACNKGERFLVATTREYQGQRNSGRHPENWRHLRDYMEGYGGNLFEKKVWLNREADDGLAYVCNAAAVGGTQHAILSADKDMRMFTGLHVVWKTYQLVDVPLGAYDVIGGDGKQYGHKWFWMQLMMGDAADYIPGLPKVGEVAAVSTLKDTTNNAEAYAKVRALYEAKMGAENWPNYMAEQAILLWMRTDRHAELDNFLTLGVFDSKVHDAVGRIKRRVAVARAELEALKQ